MNANQTAMHPVLQKLREHPVSPPARENYFQCASGDRLFYRTWVRDKPRRIIVGLHGLGAHSEYFVLVADRVIETGTTLYAPDFKHHGRSTGPTGDLESIEEIIEQLHEFIAFVKAQHPGVPLFLSGLSMGGGIALYYVNHHPGECSGLILFAPSVGNSLKLTLEQVVKFPYYMITHLFARGRPVINIVKNGEISTSNPIRLEYDSIDPLRTKKISVRFILNVKRMAQFNAAYAGEIQTPLLLFEGKEDKIVNPESVRTFFNNVGSQDKTLVEVEGAWHSLFTEKAMEEKGAWARLRDWLNAH
jgi:alpha-beta hydrolase superfamily lysophospholipase